MAPSGFTLAALMDDVAVRHATDEQIFVGQAATNSLTTAQVDARARHVAQALGARGIDVGDRIAVRLGNTPECLIACRAVFALGGTLVPIPTSYGEAEVGLIVRDAGASCLFSQPWRADGVDILDRLRRTSDLEVVVVAGAATAAGCAIWDELEDEGGRLAAVHGRFVTACATPSDIAFITYTSGSTATPKGAMHSHGRFIFEQRHSSPPWRVRNVRWLSALPFGHMAGLLAAVRPLLVGGESVVLESWDPMLAIDVIQRYSLQASSLPPFHLTTLLEAADQKGIQRLELADCLVGSTAVQPSLVERADGRGLRAYRSYGSSEHPSVSSSRPTDELPQRAQTDGRLLAGVAVRIVDDDDCDLPAAEEGNILSKGGDLFMGYTDRSATAAAFTPDGWYRSGDIGRLRGGVLTITGRKKEVIIRGGENLSPGEIEAVLLRHPLVVQAAVVGRADDRYGERPWAFIVTRENRTLSLDDVRRHFARAGVSRHKTPEGVVTLESLPVTAIGKVRKEALREMLTRGANTLEP